MKSGLAATTKPPEIIDLVEGDDADDAERLALVEPTEPTPEPTSRDDAVMPDLLEVVAAMHDRDDEDEAFLVREDVEAMMAVCGRLAREAVENDVAATQESATAQETEAVPAEDAAEEAADATPAHAVVLEEIVVALEEEEPSWLERKCGPWVARHREALRLWLLGLLVVYVSLFASMLIEHGVRGLSERSLAAIVRDLLWVVLMGIIVLLAVGKHY